MYNFEFIYDFNFYNINLFLVNKVNAFLELKLMTVIMKGLTK